LERTEEKVILAFTLIVAGIAEEFLRAPRQKELLASATYEIAKQSEVESFATSFAAAFYFLRSRSSLRGARLIGEKISSTSG